MFIAFFITSYVVLRLPIVPYNMEEQYIIIFIFFILYEILANVKFSLKLLMLLNSDSWNVGFQNI